MKKQWIIAGLAMMLLVCMAGAGPAVVEGADLPKVLNLATMPPGMIVNAQGVGIADICTKYTPMTIKVLTATNEMAWMPMLLTGEVDLGVGGSLAIQQAYLGTFVFEGIAKKAGVKGFPVRIVGAGSPLMVNFLVRGDDPAQKVADLKGRRVVSFREGTHFDLYTKAKLVNGGLSLDDVIEVPASNPLEGGRAVIEGRADTSDVALGAPIVAEAVAKVNARWLPMDPSPAAVKRMKVFCPTVYVAEVPGGIFPEVPKPARQLSMS
jgi:TRAP transporter TAXI family solute receptor